MRKRCFEALKEKLKSTVGYHNTLEDMYRRIMDEVFDFRVNRIPYSTYISKTGTDEIHYSLISDIIIPESLGVILHTIPNTPQYTWALNEFYRNYFYEVIDFTRVVSIDSIVDTVNNYIKVELSTDVKNTSETPFIATITRIPDYLQQSLFKQKVYRVCTPYADTIVTEEQQLVQLIQDLQEHVNQREPIYMTKEEETGAAGARIIELLTELNNKLEKIELSKILNRYMSS